MLATEMRAYRCQRRLEAHMQLRRRIEHRRVGKIERGGHVAAP
jgi:hypothetical protein